VTIADITISASANAAALKSRVSTASTSMAKNTKTAGANFAAAGT